MVSPTDHNVTYTNVVHLPPAISVTVELFLISYVAEKVYCKQIFILSCYNIMVVYAK